MHAQKQYWGAFAEPLLPSKSSITYSECVYVAVVTQHAMRIPRFILWSVACSALPYFSTLSHKWRDLLNEKVTEYKTCIFIFYTTFVWNTSHPKKNWMRYDLKMYIGLHVKCPLYLSDFNDTLIVRKIFKQ
jgi:hypothetical protein